MLGRFEDALQLKLAGKPSVMKEDPEMLTDIGSKVKSKKKIWVEKD